MSEILARTLGGKPVVGIDGTDFGTLSTVTMDPDSGALRDLVVDARGQTSAADVPRGGDDGRLQIPVSRVEAVNDQIVVQAAE
ncbi:PRC-barrel domain-containing protein [Natrinema versiforme]|uniref:PRC-barrel domain-containing protein n=1 Tax=Natrinema versiforme JCM 10478 TaxID=1227496 RepID=L9Y5G8_9EURY|nr:PRC-barrel domain-containing protein [Natrinema versiforme]ELY68123.1 hypothetical protein C489_08975 [Natrinema versiforme JCM 10478]